MHKKITMKFLRNYIEKQKKKSIWSWIGDVFFVILVIGLLIPNTRTPIMVFVKKITLFSPSVSADKQYGKLQAVDYQWQLKDVHGNVVDLSHFDDKPIFINFWATWCPPCIAEMPSIESLAQEYGQKVHFLLVSYEKQAITKPFLFEKGLKLETYRMLSKEPSVLSSSSIPVTFIIDKDGHVLVKEMGSSDWNSRSVKELLDRLIAD